MLTPVPIFTEMLDSGPDDDGAEVPEVARAVDLVEVPCDVVVRMPETEDNDPETRVTKVVCGGEATAGVTITGAFGVF
jgi:hypothetical protein